MNIVILGLSITSSWGNGHATTFRGLVRELNKQGHQVLFLERDVPWNNGMQDLPNPDYCQTALYVSLEDLEVRFTEQVKRADMVIVGSYVPQGVKVGEWVVNTAKGLKAFYDLDTPVTLAKLAHGDHEYVHPDLIPKYDLYLSSTGGPTLDILEKKYQSPMARAFYRSVDAEVYFPKLVETKWDLGYQGIYSEERQPQLEKLMVDAAKQWPLGRFAVAGQQFPRSIKWPTNVEYIEDMPASEHQHFYNSQRFTLNITRADMASVGYTPSARLFEAAACCTPIITDNWDGLDTFFEPETEILIASSAKDSLRYLREICKSDRKLIAERARKKVMANHTTAHRVNQLLRYAEDLGATTYSIVNSKGTVSQAM